MEKDPQQTSKPATEKPRRSARSEVGTWSIKLLLGDIVSSSFFTRHKYSFIGIVVLLILYITFKYECQTKMETIDKLNKELSIVRSEAIREQSTYRSRTRESKMQELVDSMHLGLQVQDQPPFILNYNEK